MYVVVDGYGTLNMQEVEAVKTEQKRHQIKAHLSERGQMRVPDHRRMAGPRNAVSEHRRSVFDRQDTVSSGGQMSLTEGSKSTSQSTCVSRWMGKYLAAAATASDAIYCGRKIQQAYNGRTIAMRK